MPFLSEATSPSFNAIQIIYKGKIKLDKNEYLNYEIKVKRRQPNPIQLKVISTTATAFQLLAMHT